MLLLRLLVFVWALGFIVLALVATSSLLSSAENQVERTRRWMSRLRMSLIWPVALLSAAGRARLRRG